MNQNGRQSRPHCVSIDLLTQWSMTQAWGQDVSLGAAAPFTAATCLCGRCNRTSDQVRPIHCLTERNKVSSHNVCNTQYSNENSMQ